MMTNFANLAATSHAVGFPYYDIQDYSFTLPGRTLPFATGGTYSHYNQTFTITKNRPNKALTSQILTNIRMNLSPVDTAGVYRKADLGISGNVIVGSSGGFPIFYAYQANIWSDATNINILLDAGNPSAVNNVTVPNLTITGRVYFYLSPF